MCVCVCVRVCACVCRLLCAWHDSFTKLQVSFAKEPYKRDCIHVCKHDPPCAKELSLLSVSMSVPMSVFLSVPVSVSVFVSVSVSASMAMSMSISVSVSVSVRVLVSVSCGHGLKEHRSFVTNELYLICMEQ